MVKNGRIGPYTHFYLFFTKKYPLSLATRITFGKRKEDAHLYYNL